MLALANYLPPTLRQESLIKFSGPHAHKEDVRIGKTLVGKKNSSLRRGEGEDKGGQELLRLLM